MVIPAALTGAEALFSSFFGLFSRRRKNVAFIVVATTFSVLAMISVLRLLGDVGLANSINRSSSSSLSKTAWTEAFAAPLESLRKPSSPPGSFSQNDTPNNNNLNKNETSKRSSPDHQQGKIYSIHNNTNDSSTSNSNSLTGTAATAANDETNNVGTVQKQQTLAPEAPTLSTEEERLVLPWSGTKAMDAMVDSIWQRNFFCDAVHAARRGKAPSLLITLQFTFGCQDLFLESITGTGNFIQAMYMMRVAATLLEHVDVDITCFDAEQTKRDLILPWLTGHWYWNQETMDKVLRIAKETHQRDHKRVRREVCSSYWGSPINYLYQEMQYDFRRMAISLTGVIPNHPSEEFANRFIWRNTTNGNKTNVTFRYQLESPSKTDLPLFPNVDLDDAVIHFRCGDLLTTNLTTYGFMKFSGYVRHISPHTRSIGILTQPFDNDDDIVSSRTNSNGNSVHDEKTTIDQPRLLSQTRPLDADSVKLQRCRLLVTALKKYIEERFPDSTVVRIRNEPNETIALTYARMIMANQTVGAMSTFSVYPIVASFGTGYFLQPEQWSPNYWLRNQLPHMFDALQNRSNVVMFEEESVMVGSATKDLWDVGGDDAVLQWFQS